MQPLQLINQTLASRSNFNQVTNSTNNMWQNTPMPNAALISINNQPLNQSQQQQQSSAILASASSSSNKPHASLRSRPISAGTSNGRLNNKTNNSWVKGFSNIASNIPSPVVDSETYRQVNFVFGFEIKKK